MTTRVALRQLALLAKCDALKTSSANRKDISTAQHGVTLEHRHFAFIAGVIDAMPNHSASLRVQKSSVANAFADACAATNPKFDRHRFLMACSVSIMNGE